MLTVLCLAIILIIAIKITPRNSEPIRNLPLGGPERGQDKRKSSIRNHCVLISQCILAKVQKAKARKAKPQSGLRLRELKVQQQ